MYILSLPRDISTLIQVFGRAVRRISHILLPSEYRNVRIYILVSSFDSSRISPELLNYKRKIDIYFKDSISRKRIKKNAIDNFINFDKMNLPDKQL